MSSSTDAPDHRPPGTVSTVLVSVIIPARSWDHFLHDTLESLAHQQLPEGVTTEVVVALASTEGVHAVDGVRFVENPIGSIPAGLNLAIAESKGQIVVRMDARCVAQPDHVTRVVHGLSDETVGCVGGAALALDRGLFGSTYAVTFNSPLLGPTVYRYRRTSGTVDAAYLGAWRRADLEALGGFDERLIRNQDNELADRVRASGQTVFYDADLVIGYHNARGLGGAIAHHHEFGLWRMFQREHGQRSLTPRHLGALGALGAAVVGGVAAVRCQRTRRAALGVATVAYGGAAITAWTTARRLRSARPDIDDAPFHPLAPVLAPMLGAVLDGAWLAGVLRGLAGATPPGAQAPETAGSSS